MSEFLMPSLGADMESAILMQWHVKEGDEVKKGQVIAEVETSKGVIEIEVFQDGVVEKLLVEEETECKVGTALAIISGSSLNTQKPEEAEPKKESEKITEEVLVEKQDKIKTVEKERILISPAARKKAEELGIELSSITKEDASAIKLKDLETKKVKKTKIQEKPDIKKEKKTDQMREAISKAMSLSNKDIPHYYLSTTINMTKALNWLELINKERDISKRILPSSLLIKACVKALETVPQLNGFWKEESLKISNEINPGVVIALRKGGVVSPALLDATVLDLDETMHNLGDLISRARSGKLKSSELTKQTITITNLGDLGVEEVFGVIYPPQVAIIGLGKIHEQPWAIDDTISVRKVLKATIAGDHRATDGRIGAKFLDKLDKILQNPQELL